MRVTMIGESPCTYIYYRLIRLCSGHNMVGRRRRLSPDPQTVCIIIHFVYAHDNNNNMVISDLKIQSVFIFCTNRAPAQSLRRRDLGWTTIQIVMTLL